MSPEEWHRLASRSAIFQWERSLKRSDLSDRDRVLGALEAYRRQFVALEILADLAEETMPDG